jgi:hypothetical protein
MARWDFDELWRRPDDQPRPVDAVGWRYPGWIWLGYIAFGIGVWAGVPLGLRALLAAL